MSDFEVAVRGLDALVKELDGLGKSGLQIVGGAMYRRAERVMADSKRDYCPVDTGALRASGHVEKPVYSGRTVTVILGYGDAAVDYARRVHEDLDAHHPVGQAKYLEVPLLAAVPEIVGEMRADIAKRRL